MTSKKAWPAAPEADVAVDAAWSRLEPSPEPDRGMPLDVLDILPSQDAGAETGAGPEMVPSQDAGAETDAGPEGDARAERAEHEGGVEIIALWSASSTSKRLARLPEPPPPPGGLHRLPPVLARPVAGSESPLPIPFLRAVPDPDVIGPVLAVPEVTRSLGDVHDVTGLAGRVATSRSDPAVVAVVERGSGGREQVEGAGRYSSEPEGPGEIHGRIDVPRAEDGEMAWPRGEVSGFGDTEAVDASAPSPGPVLVVSADSAVRDGLVQALTSVGVAAFGAAGAEEATALQSMVAPAVALVDDNVGGVEGAEIGRRLQASDPHMPLLLLAGTGDLEAAVRSTGRLDSYLPKPMSTPTLVHAVRNALSRRFLAEDHFQVIERLHRLDSIQALYDPLTELPNRALLDDRLRQVLAKSQRDGTAVAVLFVDLDGFKVVNDVFGHHVGDHLLREAGARLAGTRRKSDTVARFGGDEFVVICPDVSTSSIACRIADKTLRELSRPVEVEGIEHQLTASIGIMVTEPGAAGQSAEMLLRNADTAMYRAKDQGRNCWELFDQSMHDRAAERFAIERDLRTAASSDDLLLAYQTIVDLRTAAMTGVEALLRWRRPGHGTVLPGTFLDVAEETALTVPIGTWALDRALGDLSRWNETERLPRGFRLWLNVSPHQLANHQFVDLVEENLERHRVEPTQVGFEIAEPSLRDHGDTVAVMGRLTGIGIGLNLDDFGARHSNLAWLEDLPLTGLKIDRRFVMRLDTTGDRGAAAMVQGLVDLAHALELTVVGEGVETRAQAKRLEAMGCDCGQGYYFGFPSVPARLGQGLAG